MSVAAGVAVMVAIGALLAPQAPMNRGLAALTGPLGAAFFNFAVGLACVLAACAVAGQLGAVWDVWSVPPGDAMGALLGIAYVLSALIAVRHIGASGVVAAGVAGQLVASLTLDATGALGLETKPLSVGGVLGAAAVFAGTYLVAGRAERVATPSDGTTATGSARRRHHHLWPLALMVCGGAAIGVQHPLNGHLGAAIGDLPAAVVNFALGSLVLLALVLAAGEAPGLRGFRRAGLPYRLGGAIGALNATVALTLVDTIGAGALAAATVSGMAIASLALDRAGLLGLRPRRVTPRRAAGALLVIAGTVLVAVG